MSKERGWHWQRKEVQVSEHDDDCSRLPVRSESWAVVHSRGIFYADEAALFLPAIERTGVDKYSSLRTAPNRHAFIPRFD